MTVETAPLESLVHLDIGSMVQITSKDGSLQYMAQLVGVDNKKTIITNMPSAKQLNKDSVVEGDVFIVGHPLVMRVSDISECHRLSSPKIPNSRKPK